MFAQGKKVIRLFEVEKHMLDYLCTAQHKMHGILNISRWCASRFIVQVARGEMPRCTK
ncbi:hypothetical protein OROMI_003475 [Orobanche minor]